MKYLLVIFLSWALPLITSSQEVIFKVEITTDTLYFGNLLGIKYTVENVQGDFEPPEFSGFVIARGPNVSSQFSMINGITSQSSSYEYILRPHDIGTYVIPSAELIINEESVHSDIVQIEVIDNPDEIRQDYRTYNQEFSQLSNKGEKKIMTKADSLKQKLRKLKARKI